MSDEPEKKSTDKIGAPVEILVKRSNALEEITINASAGSRTARLQEQTQPKPEPQPKASDVTEAEE